MSGLIPPVLTPGIRFSLKNQAFEITFVDANMVRYASCIGGRIQKMPTTTFWELVDTGTIGFLDKSENVPMVGKSWHRLSYLSESEREAMLYRFNFVKEMISSDAPSRGRKNLIKVIREVSQKKNYSSSPAPSTLARWTQRYINSGGDVTVLVPQHAKKGCRYKKFPDAVEKIIARSIRDDFLTLERPTVAQVYCNVIGRICEDSLASNEVLVPSARTMYRRIRELDPYVHALKRHGKRYADLRFRAAGASIESSRLMEMVMMDGHKMDVIIVDPETGEVLGRPFLVCLFDVYTRTVVGWHISLMPFCATTALAAIKDMCRRDPTKGPGGVAENILPDNGPDLASKALRNLCAKLGMHIQPAKSYCPDDKAFIERFFRTLCTQLVHMLQGTTFSSPTQRGDYDSTANATITIERLRELFKQWLDENYHKAIHSVTNRAPLLAWRDMQAEMPILFFPKEDIDVIARISYLRKISNGRVIVDNLAYKSDALATLEMRDQRNVTVMVDEMNLEYVYVSPASDPKLLIRADCVRTSYAKNLTKYEHDQVQKDLAALAQKDRDELSAYAYEIARWRLWNSIHNLANAKSSRQLKLLTEGIGPQKAARQKTAAIRTPADGVEITDSSAVTAKTRNSIHAKHNSPTSKPSAPSGDDFEVFEI